MAFPIILVDSGTGSDTLASGAGPATALTGTAASTDVAGTTVTLDGSPDLTNVATDGSHSLFLNDSTAGARNHASITAKDNGAKTVTVANAFASGVSGKAWAIGGKRATIGGTLSKKLFDNNGATGDARPGWIVELSSGYTETISATLDIRVDGSVGSTVSSVGVTLRGTSGGTRPILTFSNNGTALLSRGYGNTVQFLELRNTNATKTASVALGSGSSGQFLASDVIVAHATDKFWRGWTAGAGVSCRFVGCEFGYCASHALYSTNEYPHVEGCYFHDLGDSAINMDGGTSSPGSVTDCIFDTITNHGLRLSNGGGTATAGAPSLLIHRNTFYNCSGDAVRWVIASATSLRGVQMVSIRSNIFANNGAYGLNFAAGSYSTMDESWMRGTVAISHNCFYSNTSGKYNPSTAVGAVSENEQTVDPGFTDAANGDFTIGTALKALGYPSVNLIGTSKRSYVDIGAMQRQEVGAQQNLTVAIP